MPSTVGSSSSQNQVRAPSAASASWMSCTWSPPERSTCERKAAEGCLGMGAAAEAPRAAGAGGGAGGDAGDGAGDAGDGDGDDMVSERG